MGTVVQPEMKEHALDKFAMFNGEYVDMKPVFLEGTDSSYVTAALAVGTIPNMLTLTSVRELLDAGLINEQDVPKNLTIQTVYYVDSGVLKSQTVKPSDIVLTATDSPMGSDSYAVSTTVGKIDVLFNMYTGELEAIPRRQGRIIGIGVALERGLFAPEETPPVETPPVEEQPTV